MTQNREKCMVISKWVNDTGKSGIPYGETEKSFKINRRRRRTVKKGSSHYPLDKTYVQNGYLGFKTKNNWERG